MAIHTATAAEPAYRKRLGYQAMLLGGICFLVAMLIIFGNISSKEAIEAALKQDKLDMLSQVLPPSLYDNNVLTDVIEVTTAGSDKTVTVNVATNQGVITGFAFSISKEGYSGPINMIMGIDGQGQIIGVRVISHTETPGLGDKIEISKANWITAFEGLSLANTANHQWAVKKDNGRFDQFAGATITPRAVVAAVFDGLQLFEQERDQFRYTKSNEKNAKEIHP